MFLLVPFNGNVLDFTVLVLHEKQDLVDNLFLSVFFNVERGALQFGDEIIGSHETEVCIVRVHLHEGKGLDVWVS